MPGITPFSKENIAWLREQSFGFMDDTIVRSDLAVLEAVDGQVTLIEEKIATIAAEDRSVRLLMTMTGVGYFTAMLVMAEAGESLMYPGFEFLCKEMNKQYELEHGYKFGHKIRHVDGLMKK